MLIIVNMLILRYDVYMPTLSPTDQRIRDAIRDAMTSRDPRITQAQLAERLGISQPAVAALITGQRGGIPQSLLNLLEELGLELAAQRKS